MKCIFTKKLRNRTVCFLLLYTKRLICANNNSIKQKQTLVQVEFIYGDINYTAVYYGKRQTPYIKNMRINLISSCSHLI